MVLGLFRVEMDLFQDLRDAHRRAAESPLVVAVGQVRNVGLFVREDVHCHVIVDLRIVGSVVIMITNNRLRFAL